MKDEIKTQTIKKLLYRSYNRGCRETGVILGEFAKNNIGLMNSKELKIFENILNMPDQDIYNAYKKKTKLNYKHSCKIMNMILEFKINNAY